MLRKAQSRRVLWSAVAVAAFVFTAGAGAARTVTAPPASPLADTHPRQVCATVRATGRGPVAQCNAWALAASSGKYLHLAGSIVRHHSAVQPNVTGSPDANVVQAMWPVGIHNAYQLPSSTTNSHLKTVAIVDAFDDPNAKSDLDTYDSFWTRFPALPDLRHAVVGVLLRRREPVRPDPPSAWKSVAAVVRRRLGARDLARRRGRAHDLHRLQDHPRRGDRPRCRQPRRRDERGRHPRRRRHLEQLRRGREHSSRRATSTRSRPPTGTPASRSSPRPATTASPAARSSRPT